MWHFFPLNPLQITTYTPFKEPTKAEILKCSNLPTWSEILMCFRFGIWSSVIFVVCLILTKSLIYITWLIGIFILHPLVVRVVAIFLWFLSCVMFLKQCMDFGWTAGVLNWRSLSINALSVGYLMIFVVFQKCRDGVFKILWYEMQYRRFKF